MSWFDPPAPPDPIRTAAAATATNIGTSVANAYLNNVNQITPTGQLRYDKTSDFQWTDPSGTYTIPTFTATQLLSPNQQQIQQSSEGAQMNLAQMARNQSGAISGVLGNPFNPNQGNFNAQAYLDAYPDVKAAAIASGANPNEFAATHFRQYGQNEGRTAGFGPSAPGAGNVSWLNDIGFAEGIIGNPGEIRSTFDPSGQQQTGFGDAGNVTRSYGPGDFSQDRQRVEESLFGRLNPQLDRERANLEQRLSDQGIRYGSPAYTAAMDDYNRQSSDMRLAVTAQGGAEQQRMMDMAAQRAGFENAAQQQAYTQALGRGTFANTAQQQQFTQNMQGAQFGNQAEQQLFGQQATRLAAYNQAQAQNLARNTALYNAQNEARQQYMNEQYAQRNQPINEITALLSGGQVSQPNFISTPRNQISTTDIAGLINNQFAQQFANSQQQSQNTSQLVGGIFGALGGLTRGVGASLSDVREKENIDRVGTVFAAGPDGEKPLPIYEYSYKRDPTESRHVGPMAQDVERIDKRAVTTHDGRKYIKNTKLGSILKVA